MIALYDKDIYEQAICGDFIEGPDNEANTFGCLKWDPSSEEGLYELFYNNKNNSAANLIHYTYNLCNCSQNEDKELLALGKGHYSDEIDVQY